MDVPGPAVVGLPTSELLHLVNVNVDTITEKNRSRLRKVQRIESKQPGKISTIEDLKMAYPD